ncbi:MAG TPA: hypothetical protein VGN17_17260 [Bryobacteraceae bacterium]|jgi:hypothetical protein
MTRFLLALAIAAVAAAQVYPQNSPYPGGQNPGGQYPSQYPNNNSPVYRPGGVPISVPEVKLPKRDKGDKNSGDKNDLKIALRAVDGTLRELGEKDLYLEVPKKGILKFRMLAKTQFRDKEGESVRDSLLKAGDQLSVQVSADDPETALRVILSRAGTQAEKTTAGRPFDRSAAKSPVEGDTHSAGSMEVSAGAPAEPTASVEKPTLEKAPEVETVPEKAPEKGPEKAPEKVVERAPAGGAAARPVEDIISKARAASEKLTDELPNFIVQQVTARTYSNSIPARWKTLDVVTAEVVSVDGKEEYRNIQVNGKASSQPIEKSGAWSTGEFAATLEDLLSPYTAANFRRTAEESVAGRKAYVYNYTVLQENSNWDIIAPTGAKASPAYSGSIWIDQETFHVLRIYERTDSLPKNFPFDKAESTLEYGFVRIDGANYVLPTHAEILTCQAGSSACTKNEINFQNYRKFAADSKVIFDK